MWHNRVIILLIKGKIMVSPHNLFHTTKFALLTEGPLTRILNYCSLAQDKMYFKFY